MSPVSAFPALLALLFAFTTALLLTRKFGAPPDVGRYASIDGLRGYLAFFVFLHHACIWYFYLQTGKWEVPPSNLYTNFGQASVALFFMITGFLFFSKLIAGRTREIDWGRLFISRLMRLVPLYFFVMLLLFVTVVYVSHGVLNQPFTRLLQGVLQWLGFTIFGAPNLNGVSRTFTIVAGVTWTLSYEWAFYCALPLLALTLRVVPPWPYLVFGAVSMIAAAIWWHPQVYALLAFAGGIGAAFLVRIEAFRVFSDSIVASFVVVGCLAGAVLAFPSSYSKAPLLLLTLAFVLMAAGSSVFGVLTHKVSRTLGEMAYSIYLLQGITLFIVFNFIVGLPESRALSPMLFWLVIVAMTPALVLVCFVTFRWIEQPGMRSTARVTGWLRARAQGAAL